MGDTTFFTKDVQGNLRCLPGDALPDLIVSVNDSTIKLDNQNKMVERHLCVPRS
jgi:hypothetical protein